jgi:hypothetical protein
MNLAYSVSHARASAELVDVLLFAHELLHDLHGHARLSALAANARTGSMASRPARRIPRNAESFSS